MGRARIRLFGYPFHPTLVVFPLALFPATFLADLAYFATGDPFWWAASSWALVLGLLGAAASVATGLADYAHAVEPSGRTTAFAHGLIGSAVTVLFAIVLLLHWNAATEAERVFAVAINGTGQVLIGIQGFLGGRLVYKHRSGLEPQSGTRVQGSDAGDGE